MGEQRLVDVLRYLAGRPEGWSASSTWIGLRTYSYRSGEIGSALSELSARCLVRRVGDWYSITPTGRAALAQSRTP